MVKKSIGQQKMRAAKQRRLTRAELKQQRKLARQQQPKRRWF